MKLTHKLNWILTLVVIIATIIACNKNKNSTQIVKYANNNTEKYADQWQKVDSLTDLQLYRSALNEVLKIKKLAFKTENTPQGIKAIMHEMKFNTFLEENDFENAIFSLDSLSETSDFPMSQILHSMTADIYLSYYQANQYQILQRTTTENFETPDFNFWDAKKFEDKINEHYFASLSQSVELQKIKLEDFIDILNFKEETEKLRPTLYDFLAFRSLNFFKNYPFDLTNAKSQSLMDNKEYFAGPRTFIEQELLNKTDKDKVINLFQDLTKFHLNDTAQEALLDVNLMRLKFVYDNFEKTKKDELYDDQLDRLLEKHHSTSLSTEVQYAMALFFNQKGQNYNPKTEDNRFKLATAANICKNAVENYPNSFGAKKCKDLLYGIEAKTLSLKLRNAIQPNTPEILEVSFKNIYTYNFKIVALDWNQDFEKRIGQNDFLKTILRKKAVKSWTEKLTDPGDYHTHNSVFKIPELNYGYYAIIISENENPKKDSETISYAKFWVTDLSLSSRTENAIQKYTVANRHSGEAMNDVHVEIYSAKQYNSPYRVINQFNTKRNGKFDKEIINNNYRSTFIHLNKGEDHYVETSNNGYYNNYQEQVTTKTNFFLDRAIFRPGQTVYFKGIKIRSKGNEHSVVKNSASTVELLDVNYQKVASLNLKTNEFGSYQGSFTLPQGLLNGQMQIKDENGSIFFSVEEYKRPKFEVTFNPIEGSYKLDEEVKLTGLAKAFAGYNIGDAKVNYRVQRTARFPYWCWYRWGFMPNSAALEIAHGELKSNDDGEFDIVFNAIADPSVNPKYSPTYNYLITADVTDINGETHSATQYVNVGYTAMELSSNLKDVINGNDFKSMQVYAKNLNGEPLDIKGKLSIHKLKEPDHIYRSSIDEKPDLPNYSEEEFHALFPLDSYGKFNPGDLEKERVMLLGDFETYENALVEFASGTKWEQGRYLLKLTATDSYGTEVEELKYFTVYAPQNKSCAIKTTDWFISLKTKCEPGENAEYLIGSSETNYHVLYEIEHQGNIVHSENIVLNNEQRLISIPVLEKHRGNFAVHFTAIKNNRRYIHNETIIVPYTNKELDITFETFRNKLLPGQQEEWRLKIKGKNGDKVAAELMTTLYDASLDEFRSNDYMLNVWQNYYSKLNWNSASFNSQHGNRNYYHEKRDYSPNRTYSSLNWFGYNFQSRYGYETLVSAESVSMRSRGRLFKNKEPSAPAGNLEMVLDSNIEFEADDSDFSPKLNAGGEGFNNIFGSDKAEQKKPLSQVKARTNFNETAFFFPNMTTNEKGEVILKFTIPESLTKWKFLGLAHTQDLKIGTIEEEVVTQKKLMVTPNIPRFLREGDEVVLSSKITNLSDLHLDGNVQLFLFDALTMQPIDSLFYSNANTSKNQQQGFSVQPNKSTFRTWKLKVPEGINVVTYKIVAQTSEFSDGEEMAVPVFTNRKLVTESLPLPIRGNTSKTFSLDKLINSGNSKSLKNHSLTLEFTSNPAWYAVQAMPYMMDYPYDCAEQTFTKYYSNTLASHIMNDNPKIKAVFDQWKNTDSDALVSNLEKNQELKSALLEETPWVLDAQDETERKKRIGLLFDLNKMNLEKEQMLNKLQQSQSSTGAWPWFNGMRDNRYITQHIVTGLGHLDHLKVQEVRNNPKTWNMLTQAINYLDNQIVKDFKDAKKHDKDYLKNQHLSNLQIQYLYARSYFKDVALAKNSEKAFNYYLEQANTYWTSFNLSGQGMIALQAHRNLEIKTANDIVKSLDELAIHHDEFGMYWKGLTKSGYYWYQAPIETQALLMEVFDEVRIEGVDADLAVEEMKIWLLKQKQTTDWKTTKATAEAVYALLMRGTDGLADNTLVQIEVGKHKLPNENTQVQAGTGYFKEVWHGEEIKPKMGNVKVTKSTDGIAWGALYWQYFEDLDKITSAETGLVLRKELFKVNRTDNGEVISPIALEKVTVGDKIRVRIELVSDRNLEYVHLKDMRASGLEPINVISTYRYQGGLGYYESTKDASTNFFMDYIPKGTYVFEYDLRVSHEGEFSNGISTIQCMYAPEYSSHSEGIRVRFEQESAK